MRYLNHFAAYAFSIATLFTACSKTSEQPIEQTNNVANALNNNIIETSPANQEAVNLNVNTNIGGFYAATPALYDVTTKKYPLLIFLHGIGDIGNGTTDLSKILNKGVTGLINQNAFPANFYLNGNNYSFIIVSPQFKQWPDANDVNDMIDYAIKNYRIDASRIYISGMNMGGGVAWDYAAAYPSKVAAIAPICGATWFGDESCAKIASANVPVWAFHNADDRTVTLGTTTKLVDLVNSHQPSIMAKETVWATGGHDAWTKATNPATKVCDGKNVYEWMLQYSRP